MEHLFHETFRFSSEMLEALERDGHVVLPGVCTAAAVDALTASMQRIQKLGEDFKVTDPDALKIMQGLQHKDASAEEKQRTMAAFQRLFHERGADSGLVGPGSLCAECDGTIASVISHPQLLDLVGRALSCDGRRDASHLYFDHCVSLNRLPETEWAQGGMGTHSHAYADGYTRDLRSRVDEDTPDEALIRVFFYITGFTKGDGSLKVIPGSHLWRDPNLGKSLRDWREAGMTSYRGVKLDEIELECPPGSVILMHTHAAHGVLPKLPTSAPRWAFVAAYRTGESWSPSRVITSDFAKKPGPGALTAQMKRQGRKPMPLENARPRL